MKDVRTGSGGLSGSSSSGSNSSSSFSELGFRKDHEVAGKLKTTAYDCDGNDDEDNEDDDGDGDEDDNDDDGGEMNVTSRILFDQHSICDMFGF